MTHKSDDYKLTAVQHYLDTDHTQTDINQQLKDWYIFRGVYHYKV
jgi:hypothetical protein